MIMADQTNKLRAALKAVSRRERAVRFVVLSGRTYLVAALLVFVVVIVRRFLVLRFDIDPLPYGGLAIVIAVTAGYLLVPVFVRLWVHFTRPRELAVARALDDRLRLRDLLASGLAADQMTGRVAEAVARRAGEAADRISPERLFPVKKSLIKTLAVIPLLVAAAYLLGLPTADGMILMAGPGSRDVVSDSPEDPVPEEEPAVEPGRTEPEVDPEDQPEDEPAPEEPEPPKISVRVVPSKKIYEEDEPIVLFVLADASEPISSAVTFDTALVLDGNVIPIGQQITVEPGPDGGAMIVIDARRIPDARRYLKGGKHQVSGILIGPGHSFTGPEEEFEIETEDDEDQDSPSQQPQPQPQPEPEPEPEPQPPPPPEPEPENEPEDESGEEAPPPDLATVPRFVAPLFGEGETVKKKGWALVPDPDAPAGSAPRRLPLDEAAREASRRPESAVPLERLKAADAATVARYFELLRSAK